MNSFVKRSIVWPGWGTIGNSGWEVTRGCYALKHKCHLQPPSPPRVANFLCQHTYHKDAHYDERVILSHFCGGLGAPLHFRSPNFERGGGDPFLIRGDGGQGLVRRVEGLL